MSKLFFTVLIVLFVAGCATGYQKQSFSGSYSETQLDTNVFRVTFKGNGYTDKDRASDFALLRSAELAITNGYEYFVIIDSQEYSKQSTITTPTTSTTTLNANTYGYGGYGNTYGTATTTYFGGQTFNISKPTATNTIICFTEKPEGFSYNANYIKKSLEAKYEIKKPNK